MQQKRVNPKIIISALVLIVAGLLAFRFLMPANCSALLQDAKIVNIHVTEAIVVIEPGFRHHQAVFETGERELIELKNLFTEYNCFYTLNKQGKLHLDQYHVQVDDAALSFHITVSDGENTRYFTIGGKYIVSGENVWRIGLSKQKAEDFQLRLYEFVMEHQEAVDE